MAGSYSHIVDGDNKFIGVELIDNLGDAYEALEECYGMISHLTGGDKTTIFQTCRALVRKTNPEYADKMTFEEFWDKGED